jgi:hypothetical protein
MIYNYICDYMYIYIHIYIYDYRYMWLYLNINDYIWFMIIYGFTDWKMGSPVKSAVWSNKLKQFLELDEDELGRSLRLWGHTWLGLHLGSIEVIINDHVQHKSFPVWHLKFELLADAAIEMGPPWTPMDSGLRLQTAHNRRLWLYEPSPSYIRTAPSETQLELGRCIIVGLVTYPTVLRRSCSHARRKDSSASSCHKSRPQGKGLTYFIPSGKRLHFAIENCLFMVGLPSKNGEFPYSFWYVYHSCLLQ